MTTVSILPQGTNFSRIAKALALHKDGTIAQAASVAEAQWGPNSQAAMILRAAVSAGTTDNLGSVAEYRVAAAEFVRLLRPLTVLGRMSGFRRAPLRVKITRQTSGSSVHWVGEGAPIKVSRGAFDTLELDDYKLAGIVTVTNELVRLADPAADGLLRADLLAAVAAMQDSALLDPTAAGADDVSPPSITYGATQLGSTGSSVAQITSDLENLFKVLVDGGINMVAPYFITTPRIAFKLAMKRDTNGALAFPGMGVRGGEIGGIPVLVSGSAPEVDSGDSPGVNTGSIVLVDAAEIILADSDAILIDVARQTTLQLDDSPDSPPTASTNLISLWQHDLTAWRVVRPINWKMARTEAVAVLTGVVL